jgi:hypothetical protein
MTASTFIFVHDQQIVLDYIAANKFHDLPDVKYCFLGMRPTDRIEHLPNVIIARNLPDNIEHFPNLVAWTGWYALFNNDMVETDVVNLLEYDVNILGKWIQSNRNIGYFAHQEPDEVWWNYNGIRTQLENMVRSDFDGTYLPMTSNYTLDEIGGRYATMILYDFLKECDPLHPQAGHVIERVFSAYFNGIPILPNRLTHLYADSHGTQGRGDRYEQLKGQLL